MRLLVCGGNSLRRKPIEAVFSAGNSLGWDSPRKGLWVVFLAADQANGRDVCTVGAHSGRIARRRLGAGFEVTAFDG